MANLTGQLFIDGLWLEGHGDFFESLQPVTGETVWDGVSASIEDVDAAVREARSAFVHWRKRPFSERQALVEKFGTLLEEHKEELAHQIGSETGKPLWESRTEVAAMIGKIGISVPPITTAPATPNPTLLAAMLYYGIAPMAWWRCSAPIIFPGICPTGISCRRCWRATPWCSNPVN